MLLEKEVVKIIFQDGQPIGVELSGGENIYAKDIIYSGTVWNLYGKLLDKANVKPARAEWAAKQIPTYSSVVLYAHVDRQVIPEDTSPVEMLIGNPDLLDESEVTAYIMSIDDKTLCDENGHTVVAIGPTFENWDFENETEYLEKKEKEKARLLSVLGKRFPGFEQGVRYVEVATPRTIERYTLKNGGAVAGPKQMLGQHMFHRMHTKSEWANFFCCGESTVMGTGTPTVTTSGLSAANAVLKKRGFETFTYQANMKNYVRILEKPFKAENLYSGYPEEIKSIMGKAYRCQYCEQPTCSLNMKIDIRGIMRRVTVGNFVGARKLADQFRSEQDGQLISFSECEERCVLKDRGDPPVEIDAVIQYISR